MSSTCLQYANFGIQCLLFLALVWYAIETWRIRKISQEQIETLQKPCLTLSATARNFEEAVLGFHDTHSAQVVYTPEGVLRLINVGLGPAFSVTYHLTP